MTNPNDPAFPQQWVDRHAGPQITFGLTKRELFAAMTMQGFMAGVFSIQPEENQVGRFSKAWERAPQVAIQMADALIAELNKQKT